APGAGKPTGAVVFSNPSGSIIDIAALDSTGRASTQAYGFAGPHTVFATYQGDAHFNLSGDTADATVNRAATTTTLTISPNPATPGASIAYSAVVGIVPPGDVDPE